MKHYSKEELAEIVPATDHAYKFRLGNSHITVKFFRYSHFCYTTCHIQVETDGEFLNCWGNTVLNPHDTQKWEYGYRVAYKRAINDFRNQTWLRYYPSTFSCTSGQEIEKKMRTKLFNLLVREYEQSKLEPDGFPK